MGQRCCRPRYRPNFSVHLAILNDIVDNAAIAEAQDRSVNKQNMNQTIRVILNVRGSLRKLYDYLAAHRHYIQQSFKYICLQITAKSSIYIMAALAEVSLKITELLSERDSLTNDEQNEEHRNKPHANVLKMYLEIEQTIFNITCDLLDQYMKSPKHLEAVLQRPLKTTLEILKQLSSEQVSTKLKTRTIKTVLDLLVQIMSSSSTQQKLALEVYRKIIQKFKFNIMSGNVYKDIVKDHLRPFLKYWIREVHRHDNNKQHLSSLQKSLQEEEFAVDNNHIEGILVQFFNSHFSYHESEYIFKELMKIYDGEGFGEVVLEIEELVFSSLTQFDLREQFIYRWFDYVLNYMAVTKDYYESIWSLTDFENPHASMKEKYPNIMNESNSVGCLRTVRRWVKEKHINIGNVLQYKGKKLLIAILLNLSSHDPTSSLLSETTLIIEYLVNQQSLFYLKLLSNIMKIITSLSSQFTSSQLRIRNCRTYIEHLVLVVSRIDPEPAIKMFQFEAQTQEQYERLYDILFFPLSSKQMNVNCYLVKATTEALKKVHIQAEMAFLEKVTNYLAGIAHILHDHTLSTDPNLKLFLKQIEGLQAELKVKAPSVLKQYLFYLKGMLEKQYNKYLVLLLGSTYICLEPSQHIRIPEVSEPTSRITSLHSKILPLISQMQSPKKSQKQIIIEKIFQNLSHQKSDMILIDGDRNSIMSNNVGTSSMADNDQQFAEIVNNIKKN